MTRSRQEATTLIDDVQNYLARINDAYLRTFLSHWPKPESALRPPTKSTLPVLTWLPEVIKAAGPDTKPLIKSLTTAADHLAWGQTYTSQDFGNPFLERYGWTELIGNRGILFSNRIACGFLLLGPETVYPSHRHEAEEVYIPLTGPTLWMHNSDEWVTRPAGVPIYHDPWIPHAIQTDAAPLLALYLWQGIDLTQKSLIG